MYALLIAVHLYSICYYFPIRLYPGDSKIQYLSRSQNSDKRMSYFSRWFSNRKLERLCLLLIGIVMGFLFWKLFSVLQRDFAEANTRLENGTMINLNGGKPAEAMKDLLTKGLYFEDPKDIAFIAAAVSAVKNTGSVIDNIGALNKKRYFVNADEAFSKGGKSFQRRVLLSRNLLGFSAGDSITFEKEKSIL